MNPISYSIYEAAKATEIPQSIIRQSIRSGELPAVKIRRRLVVRRDSLDAWLQSYERRMNEAV